ncbi:DUF6541 family protein [Leucobacter aridicollis]|uniref:DUF6541 family protein n=1 Tax=Leucobacter aridicollis TaxID=283878 RepID=UPI000E64A111|nr:DUF6541 family protein [Leucobacter aridicollis]UTX52787.1 hypothetical protein KI794_13860 [Leucobacter aridicollis]
MTEWLALLFPLTCSLALVATLGLPAALALGARGFTLALLTIPAAFAVISVASIALPLAGLTWTPVTVCASGVGLALLLLIARRWLGSQNEPPSRAARFWPVSAAAAIGGAAIAVSLVLGIKGPSHVSQSYDAIFHLNAVRFILDTGSASPFDMTLATSPDAAVYYPTPWHGFVALIVQLSGASIPLATNAAVFTVACVVWPIGAVALGRAVAGPSMRVTLVSGILAAAFPSFPLLLVRYGVLYPNLLATALIPFAFVALLALLNLGPARTSFAASNGTRIVLFLGALGAASTAHPNAFFALVVVSLPAVFVSAYRGWRRPGQEQLGTRVAIALGLLALCGAIGFLWLRATTSDNGWEGTKSFPAAVWDAFGSSPRLEGHAWVLTALVVIGAIIAIGQRRHRWLIISYAALLLLFGVANGLPASALRTALIGLWYNDAWRLAAILPLAAIPLAVLGLSTLAALIHVGWLRWRALLGRDPATGRAAAAGAAVLLALAATQGSGIYAAVQAVSSRYDPVGNPILLSEDEETLLKRLDEHVPADTVLAANPWNGGSLAYAISDREVLVAHTGGLLTPEVAELTSNLADGGARVCELAADLNVEFVLDFGERYVFPGTPRAEPFAGISGVEDSSILTEVDREGDAVLFEITGCSQ